MILQTGLPCVDIGTAKENIDSLAVLFDGIDGNEPIFTTKITLGFRDFFWGVAANNPVVWLGKWGRDFCTQGRFGSTYSICDRMVEECLMDKYFISSTGTPLEAYQGWAVVRSKSILIFRGRHNDQQDAALKLARTLGCMVIGVYSTKIMLGFRDFFWGVAANN